MADEEERGDLPSRGNEWEVVSLTASTFAAAPSERALKSTHDEFPRDEEEFSSALFMSKHFIFPPSKHENLPIEHDAGEIHNETGSEEGIDATEACGVDSHLDEGDKFTKDEDEKWKGLSEVQDIQGIYLFDEGKRLSDQGSEFGEGKILEGLNLVPVEESIYTTSKCTSFPGEAESSVVFEPDEPSQINPDSHVRPKTEKENKAESGLPCEAWWRRCATSFYSHAKEANAFWSVVVAAALMGLVVLGQRWQRESWQLRQLKWQIGVNDESLSRVFGPASRLKDALVDQPRGPTIHGGSSAKH